jgi:hypothetical protein
VWRESRIPQRNLQRESRRLIMGGFCFLVPSWCPTLIQGSMGMFGAKKTTLVTIRCVCCLRWQVVRVDPEDLHVYKHHNFSVQDAFINRDGKPYLDSGERELFISAICRHCWSLLCPSDPMAYS